MSQNSLLLPTTGTVSGLTMTQNTNAALDTLNTLASGSSAPGTPEAGQLWHNTTNNTINILSDDATTWIPLFALDQTRYTGAPANLSQVITPQGRLSLSSSAVMTTDATAISTINYLPYVGNTLPIFNGSIFLLKAFTSLALSLNSTNHPTGKVYDVYASLQSGTLTLSAMYWGNNSTRSSSAGGFTGTGNATFTIKNGLPVNNAAISASDSFSGSTGVAIPQYQGLLLGSFYTTGAGTTGVNFKPAAASGGSNCFVGLSNACNRVRAYSKSMDSSTSWTYGSASWRPANNSALNRVTWLDSLGQSQVKGTYQVQAGIATSNDGILIGVTLNSSGGPVSANGIFPPSGSTFSFSTSDTFDPQLGLNFLQAVENSPSAVTATFYGNTAQMLTWEGEY